MVKYDSRSKLIFEGRLALQQRVLPAYRAPFFDLLASSCDGGLSVFAGDPRSEEGINTEAELHVALDWPAKNRHFLHPASGLYLCWQSDILDWLADWRPDALIVEANPRCLSTRQAVRWAYSQGHPVLGWGLGVPSSKDLLSWMWGRIWRSWLRSLDGVIAYSHKGAAQYRAMGVPPERVFVATNAVTPAPKEPTPDRPVDLLDPPVILFVGRLQRRKRVDLLLEACRSLPKSNQPRLVIVGDGPARDELESLAKRIYPQTEFPGAVHGSDLEPYYIQADLFVLPGTGGLAVQQAMAYGLPIIVAQGDGTQEDLVRPENGWQIPSDDLPALINALSIALRDVSRLRRMGIESYRIVSEEINLSTMVKVFVQALQKASASESLIA
jgi:glycosyltransferase involved in cell wall biosynthesis